MSYYRYLSRHAPGFLKKYQTETYSHLQRSTMYANIVHMNATTSLSVDEDITLNFKAPFTITNVCGFLAVVYWYFYHVDMYSANSLRNRLRSYHNYKMWGRLEIAARKNSVEDYLEVQEMLENLYLARHAVTREQLNTIMERCQAGETADEVLADMGLRWNSFTGKMERLQ